MIVVFGANGQLGQELVRTAALRRVALAGLPRSTTDIADAEGVGAALRTTKPDLVVNAAAYTKVDLAEKDIAAAERGNVLGPATIASACADVGVPLIHISTDYVFDGAKTEPYREDDPIAPLGVYGRTKAAGEEEVRRRLPRHVILRTAWVYGEFGNNFLKTMLRLVGERDELRVVADQRGCPTSTRDLADAVLRIAPRLIANEAVWGTYHVTGSGMTTWHGFAERIVAAQAPSTGRKPRVIPIATAEYPTPAKRPANSVLSCERFAEVFGFRARPWEQASDETTLALVQPRQAAGAHHAA